jgi:fatty acid desaturase
MLKKTYYTIRKQLAAEGKFQINNTYGALTVLAEAACFIVGLVWLIQVPHFSWAYWLLQLFLGLSIFRCFVILHECGHNTLFQQRSLNTGIGYLLSCLCFHPYTCWQEIHQDHHRWVGVVDKDPTEIHWLKLKDSKLLQNLFRLLWRTWLPIGFIKYMVEVFWFYPIQKFKQRQYAKAWRGLFSIAVIVLSHLALILGLGVSEYLVLFAPMIFVFFVWIENMILPFHSGLFPYLFADHPQPIAYSEQDSITRTIEMVPILAVLFAYNFNLHTEHHLFPYAPWYQLPSIKQKIQDADGLQYIEAEFLYSMIGVRDRDPIDLYVSALPPH